MSFMKKLDFCDFTQHYKTENLIKTLVLKNKLHGYKKPNKNNSDYHFPSFYTVYKHFQYIYGLSNSRNSHQNL